MKQTSTGSTATGRKGTRIPVAARSKALTERSEPHRPKAGRSASGQPVDDSARRAMIAQAAYFRAERRGFVHGGELDDWLEAEREISRILES